VSGPVVLAVAADAAYALPLAVTLRSAARALAPGRALRAYVIDDGLGAELRDRVAASLPSGVELRWVSADDATAATMPTWGRMPTTTFQRLLVAALLPAGEPKAIWLDCDVLVAADLGRLWDEPMRGRPLLAARDMAVPFVSSRLGLPDHRARGIPADAHYFNAGVMVLDLDAWREGDIAGRVLRDLTERASPPLFWDQDALNAVLHAEWGAIDPRWNVNAGLAGRRHWRPRHLGAAAARAVAEDPWVHHFCGNVTPWRVPDTRDPGRARWYAEVDGTPWAGWRPEATTARRLVAAYESSRLRAWVHPVEVRGFEALASVSRARRR
jgi:lipopolysaccharide biosynthesis glycosyltransferase